MGRMDEGNYFGRLQSAGVAQLNNEKQTPYMYLTFSIMTFPHGLYQTE